MFRKKAGNRWQPVNRAWKRAKINAEKRRNTMITKDDLKTVVRADKEIAAIDEELNHTRGLRRKDLELQRSALKAKRDEAEDWISEIIESGMLHNGLTACIFSFVFIRGLTQRRAAEIFDTSEQYVSRLIREGIDEINEKSAAANRNA